MSVVGNPKIRIRHTKQGKVRFTSHRDVARMWERALRRVRLPVAYSEGFSPRPKLSFGLALSTGYESLAEYLDVELSERIDLTDLPPRLTEALPSGLEVAAVADIERSTDSLQQAITSCTWEIEVSDTDLPTVTEAVARALAAEHIVVTRERKGKPVTDDLRPLVRHLDVTGSNESGCRLTAVLGTQPRALRPAELLAALEPPLELRRVLRTHQWIDADTGRREPLAAASGSAAHSEACVP
ncbi:MAG: TIGR03936 family radical SAM-associated protein [Acidimicrobiia bacterium]|nr:TIGR03936 family radical SAM-associated protein [Acidimicrobiia bacterium]MDH5236233.1 TIGR03936 family radical SAM-associated protein [Acidimicrobiia bacterium]